MQSSKTFTKKYFEKLPLNFVLLLLVFAMAIFSFSYLAHEVLWEKEEAFDGAVFNFLSAKVITPQRTVLMTALTYFASAGFLQIAYAVLALLYLFFKDLKRAGEIAFIGIGGYVINYFMKLSFRRLRPPHPLIEPLKNFSFPSGHATSGFIFYGLLVYLVWKMDIARPLKYLAAALLILFALLIGFSRIYLRLHYTTDVLAGFCVGLAWLSLVVGVLEYVKKHKVLK